MPQSCPSNVDGHRRSRGVTFNPTATQKHGPPSTTTCLLPPRYELKRELGKGSYGKVYEAFDSKRDCKVAVKRINNLFMDKTDCKRILREISILSALDHKHIIRLLDLPLPSDLSKFGEIHMVLEKADTDLQKLLRSDFALNLPHTTTMFHGLLLALKYLHSAGIYHRDLKPANCLTNRDCTVKLCDFGLSRAIGGELRNGADKLAQLLEENKRVMTGHVVTRWYRAPELCLLQDNYTEAIDVWSAACIYAELVNKHTQEKSSRWILFPGQGSFALSPNQVSGKKELPGHAEGSKDQLKEIFNVMGTPTEQEISEVGGSGREYLRKFERQEGKGLRNVLPHASPESLEILEGMLQFSAKGRMTVDEALRHRLFAEMSDESREVTASALVALEYEGETMDETRLRHYFCKEIRKFHPETPEF